MSSFGSAMYYFQKWVDSTSLSEHFDNPGLQVDPVLTVKNIMMQSRIPF